MFRTFVAIDIDEGVRAALARQQDELRPVHSAVRWAPVETIHLTVKFLGDTPDAYLSEVSDILRELCSGVKPFTLRVAGLTAFPEPERPRVIVAEVEAPQALHTLNEGLEDASAELGLGREERRYKPHLTIGRVKGRKGAEKLTARINEAKDTIYGETLVDEVVYYMSELTPDGPHYTPLYQVPLTD